MAEDRMLNDEILLGLIKANSGGGGGGTTNYNQLENKPQIAGTELQGNKSLADLGIASEQSVEDITNGESINNFAGVETALDGVETALATKQNATDNSLQTTDKTVVGAINEHEGDIGSLKSGLTTLDNEVNGDATTYPYADVITIEDAVPANLADCSVKIEPVQDLHGQSAPYVGGAGKNQMRFPYTHDSSSGSYGGITATVNDDGSIRFVGTSSTDYYFKIHTDDDKLAVKAGTWTVSSANAIPAYIGVYVGSTFLNNQNLIRTLNFAEDTDISVYVMIPTSAGQVDFTLKLQIEAGETATTWAPWSNICPISGHTEAVVTRDGKNIFDVSTYPFTDNYFIHYVNGEPIGSNTGFKCTFGYIPIIAYRNKTLTLNKRPTGGDTAICFYDSNKLYLSGIRNNNAEANTPWTFQVPNNAVYMRFTTALSATDVQIEVGAETTPYEPYSGQQYTLALGDTIYGGTVDFDSGVMTVDRGIVDLGTLTWDYSSEYTRFTSNVVSNMKAEQMYTDDALMCSCFDIDNAPVAGNDKNGTICTYSNQRVYAKCYQYDNAIDFTTAMDGQKLTYKLATPTTIQLTPEQIQLLKGTNTLYASTGDISVTVNGVSGAIGSVQEQVNGLVDEVAEIKPLNYSTTEQKTGQKWIDGKDIYIKTISLAETDFTKTNNWFWQKDIEPLITGYETIVKIFGAAIIEFDGSKHLLPFGSELYNVNNSDKCIKFANYYRNIIIKGTPYNDSDINFATKNLAIVKCNITVAYTKTNT